MTCEDKGRKGVSNNRAITALFDQPNLETSYGECLATSLHAANSLECEPLMSNIPKNNQTSARYRDGTDDLPKTLTIPRITILLSGTVFLEIITPHRTLFVTVAKQSTFHLTWNAALACKTTISIRKSLATRVTAASFRISQRSLKT